jgi:hypothetical protein
LAPPPPATKVFVERVCVPVFTVFVFTAVLRVYATFPTVFAVIEALYVVGPKVNAVDAYALVKSAFAEVAAVHVIPSAE